MKVLRRKRERGGGKKGKEMVNIGQTRPKRT
jgi:hypothetical protein